MNNSQPPTLEKSTASHFPKILAIGSIFAPLIVILVFVFLFEFLQSHGHTNLARIEFISVLSLSLPVAGLILGIVALVRSRRDQRKGIFVGALVGISLNSLFLVAVIALPLALPLITSSKFPTTPQGRLDRAVNELAAASTDEQKFYALDDAAKESFNVGKIQDARNYAKELLALAPKFQSNWNYGNAIQDGNIVLGRIAVRNGQIEAAKQYLLKAGHSPGSPQMDSFGPNMSLAKDLLKKGQRDVVLQYFELCRKFWKMDYGKLNQWSRQVKAGKIPDFGANLVY